MLVRRAGGEYGHALRVVLWGGAHGRDVGRQLAAMRAAGEVVGRTLSTNSRADTGGALRSLTLERRRK